MLTKEKLLTVLKEIPDPELNISVVDLGLIYDIKMDKRGKVEVIMTLTTMGCPLYELIARPIEERIKGLPGVKSVNIELTFDPPWTPEKMSKEAKVALGFF